MSLAYFAFYPNDFIGAISHLTTSQTGAYIKILCFLWQKEFAKENYLKAVGYGSVNVGLEDWEPIVELLQVNEEGLFYNRRLEEERIKAVKKHEAQVNNGKKGGRPKNSKPTTNPNQKVIESQDKPMANPSANPIESNHNHNHNHNHKEIKDKRLSENVVSKPKKKTLEERKEEFKENLKPYFEEYGKEMLNKFFLHFAEHNEGGRKMLFEKQSTWNLGMRLKKWKSKERPNNNFGKPRVSAGVNNLKDILQDTQMQNLEIYNEPQTLALGDNYDYR